MSVVAPVGLIAFQSDRVEELVDRLVEELARDEERLISSPRQRPFLKHKIVIPTKNLETYLTFEIAARRGVAAGLEYMTVQRFLESLLPVDEGGEPLVRVLDQGAVTRLLVSVLDDPEVLGQEVMAPVRRFIYAQPDATAGTIERRRFQLAFRVARLFEDYGYSRREMLEEWSKGRPGLQGLYGGGKKVPGTFLVGDSHLGIEAWQMAIWRALFGSEGRLGRVQEADGDERDWRTLPDAIHHYATRPELSLTWPKSVHIFGQSYLPRFFRDLFSMRTMAQDGRIAMYVMNPCLEHWSHGVAGDRDEDPVFEILMEESPLSGDEYLLPLEVWGRAGRDFQRMLDEVAYDRIDVSGRGEREDYSVLQCFQAMIRNMATARDVFVEREVPGDKKSLNFWSCANVQRECESIASEIWELVQTHENLRFNDIAVVVQPGERTVYQTHLQAAFAQSGGIPCNIIDVQGAQKSPLLEAVRLFLELPLGKFRRRELLSFLVHPCVVANVEEADITAWMRWCDEVNIFQGGGPQDLEETYLTRDRFTWEQGMRRLLLGAFMSQPDPDRPLPFEVEGQDYLVHETSHQQVDTMVALTMLVDELVTKARRARHARRTLSAWMTYFRDEIGRHIQFRDRHEERIRMNLLGTLSKLAEGDLCPDEEVGYRTAFDFVSSAMAEMEESYGQYLADGVVISAFRPMRPIPFEVVFITGLGEGRFPAPNPPDMLDLRRVRSRMHDVNPRYQDQYMFLETLMSTRSRLYLSWVGRHAITGDQLEPASVVHQLREMIASMAPTHGEGALEIRGQLEEKVAIIEQPLRRYHDRYFPELSGSTVEVEVIDARGADAIPPGPEPVGAAGKMVAERVFPNHHREAWQEARVRAGRRQLEGHLPDGFRPTMQQFRQSLSAEVFEELRDALNWQSPESGSRGAESETVVLQFHHLRKFLECPLQGSARAILGLYSEEDDDLLDVDHEPFEADFLKRLMLVRGVIEEALCRENVALDRENLSSIFDDHARVAELAGNLPSGIFFEAEREKCINQVMRYVSGIKSDEVDEDLRLKRIRFGAPRERESVDEVREPLRFEVQLPGEGGPRRVQVELHGLVKVVGEKWQASVVWAGGSRAGAKYFVQGAIEQIALRAAGIKTEGAIKVVTNKGKLKEWALEPHTEGEAAEYLQLLTGELLGEVHDYFLPVELAEDLLSGKAENFPAHAEQKKEKKRFGSGYQVSSQYGPVRRWQDSPPRDKEEAAQMARRRFAPLLGLLKGDK